MKSCIRSHTRHCWPIRKWFIVCWCEDEKLQNIDRNTELTNKSAHRHTIAAESDTIKHQKCLWVLRWHRSQNKQTLAPFPCSLPLGHSDVPIRFQPVAQYRWLWVLMKISPVFCYLKSDASDPENGSQPDPGSNKAVKTSSEHTGLRLIQPSHCSFIGILAGVIIGTVLVPRSQQCWVETFNTPSTAHFITKTLSSPFSRVRSYNN